MIPTCFRREWRCCALVAIAAMATWQLGCSQPTTRTLPLETPALRLEQPMPAPGQSARRVANIGGGDSVVVPSVAHAGQPFQVTVTTYGGGCISEDTTVVAAEAHSADIVPFQRWYQPRQNEGCTMELRINKRQVALTFAQPGVAVVRVYGRGQPDGSLMTVVREVSVE
jgi:hypothetical protein